MLIIYTCAPLRPYRQEGEFPEIGPKLTRIRRLYLGHNRFLGKFDVQLTQLATALETDRQGVFPPSY